MQFHLTQLLDALQRMTGQQQLEHLVEHARFRHIAQQVFHLRDRRSGGRIELHTQLGREAHRTQHAHWVFAVAHLGISDHAQDVGANVGIAVVVVEYLLGSRIEEQGIGGEVAPRCILLLVAEFVVAQDAAMIVRFSIFRVDGTTEGGDLDRLLTEHHMHQLETASDDARATEHTAHFLGCGIRCHIEILGISIQHEIAHSATYHEGFEPCCLQTISDTLGAEADALAAHFVRLEGNHQRCAHRAWRNRFAEYSFEQSFYHCL